MASSETALKLQGPHPAGVSQRERERERADLVWIGSHSDTSPVESYCHRYPARKPLRFRVQGP